MASSTGWVALPIGILPRVALAEVAAHADQRQERKAPAAGQRQHVDAVADAAALHEKDAARAAEIGPGQQRHALLLGGQRHRVHVRVGERAVDQDAVAGVGHIGELRDLVLAQQVVDLVLPGRGLLPGLGLACSCALQLRRKSSPAL